MIPHLIVDFDTADAVPEALAQHGALIRSAARRHAKRDSDLEEDLIQEAAIRLWELDPTRFDAGDRWFLEQELLRHIRRERKREWRAAGRGNRVPVRGL
jgi:DNA-directed RNA polymerase specialized sigma24 family protein